MHTSRFFKLDFEEIKKVLQRVTEFTPVQKLALPPLLRRFLKKGTSSLS
jgi:branched-subunit amino acid transport protein